MNNNFYDDNKEIKYLKSIPETTFYFSPIKNRIIKIVMCESVIHCITNNSQIYSWGNDINNYGLFGCNNENFNIDSPLINKKLNSLKIFDIYCGFRHCCGRDYNNNLYIWGYYFGGKPKIIDCKVRLFNCGNDVVIYCKENEKYIVNYFNNKTQKITKFDIGSSAKDIFCGNNIIVVKNTRDKILVLNEFGIHQVNYYNKNGFRIDNLAVRYNEIFILLNNGKGEQLLLRYSPCNESTLTKTTFEFYERLYKINLKKKIKLIYSTSSHYINGIFFEIECEEKEKNTYELKKDQIFTLINRNYKEKKVSISKIKDLSEEERDELSKMNILENDWEGKKRNYSLESNKLIDNLKNRNKKISYEDFFNGSMVSDKNMQNLTSRNISYIKIKEENFEDEDEKKRKRLEQLKLKRERQKKIKEDEFERLKKISDEKNKKRREEERKRQEEILRKKKEEEEREKERKRQEDLLKKQKEDKLRLKREELLKKQREEEEKEKEKERLKYEEFLRKKKEDEEKEKRKQEELLRKKLEEEENERRRKEELLRKKLEEEENERKRKEELLRKKKEDEERKKQEELLRKKKEEEERLKNNKIRSNTSGNINKNNRNKFVNVNKDGTKINNQNSNNTNDNINLRGGKKINNINNNNKNNNQKGRNKTNSFQNNLKNKNKNDTNENSSKNNNNINNKLKSSKKPVEEQLMFNGRRVIKLNNKGELIDILNNPDNKNDETIYYYIDNNKEDMSDLLSPNDYFPFNGKNLIKVKGGKIIKNQINNKNNNHPRIKAIKINKVPKKNQNSDIINKYFGNNNSFSKSRLSDSYNFDKARNLENATRGFVRVIPKERKEKKQLKMRLISEVKNLEKNNSLDSLSFKKKKRIRSFAITDEKALNSFREKIHTMSKYHPRKSMPDFKDIGLKGNIVKSSDLSSSSSKISSEENKVNTVFIDNSQNAKTKLIPSYNYDLTKTFNTKILKPYELDD